MKPKSSKRSERMKVGRKKWRKTEEKQKKRGHWVLKSMLFVAIRETTKKQLATETTSASNSY